MSYMPMAPSIPEIAQRIRKRERERGRETSQVETPFCPQHDTLIANTPDMWKGRAGDTLKEALDPYKHAFGPEWGRGERMSDFPVGEEDVPVRQQPYTTAGDAHFTRSAPLQISGEEISGKDVSNKRSPIGESLGGNDIYEIDPSQDDLAPGYGQFGAEWIKLRQRPYTSPGQAYFTPRAPVFFGKGITVEDALKRLCPPEWQGESWGSDDSSGIGIKLSCRVNCMGYQDMTKPFNARDDTAEHKLIDKQKLARNLAKAVRDITSELSKFNPTGEDPTCEIKQGLTDADFIITELHHVSQGSWQPTIYMRRK